MMKYCVALLITELICYSPTEANEGISKILNEKPQNGIIYFFVVNFLRTCDLDQKKILVFDDIYTQDSFRALADIQPQVSVSLFTTLTAWNQLRRHQVDDLRVDAIIIVINVYDSWRILTYYFGMWQFNQDCIIYIFPVPLSACASYKFILEEMMRFYFPVVYYICLLNDSVTRVYTHDPYGDTKPAYWEKISQDILWGKNWTFYERGYPNDMRELCPGFYFERTDPTDKMYVIVKLRQEDLRNSQLETEDVLYTDEIEDYLTVKSRKIVNNLKRLLKVQFKYYLFYIPTDDKVVELIQKRTGVDLLIFQKSIIHPNQLWNFFYPVSYDSFVILSHNRGLMTPLEKIAKYYGIWTLSSLIILFGITFMVIWLASKKPWLAVFDIIRLLINTGIVIPINTRSLRIYFVIIFLYFLIIHATFSGHLAEFLTHIKYRSNIDTMDDLKDSRVKKIYGFSYVYHKEKEFDDLRHKFKVCRHVQECVSIIHNPNHVCIAPSSVIEGIPLRYKNVNISLYISKNKYGGALLGYSFRPGFPLYEKFNWAFIYFSEIAIADRGLKLLQHLQFESAKRRSALANVNYRNITRDDLHFAFVLLIAGYCAGFMSFLFELSFKYIFKLLKKRYSLKHRATARIVVKPN